MNKEAKISTLTLETQAQQMYEEKIDRLTVVQTLMKLAEKNPLAFVRWLFESTNQKKDL